MTSPEPTRILASRLHEAKDKVEKANRRLAKAGLTERFTLTVSEVVNVESFNEYTGLKSTTAYRNVTLNTPALGYNGWTFVATLSFEEGGTVVRTVPGQTCSYRPTDKVCDQCHTARERNETFIVRSDAGEYKQVGRNCLALFFGLKPALWVFDYSIGELGGNSGEGGYGTTDNRIATLDIVAAALAVSNMGRAYVSAQAEHKVSTKEDVQTLFWARPTSKEHDLKVWLEEKGALAAQYANDGTATSVIEYVKNLKGYSEYAENARILANSEYVDVKNLGIVASFAKVWANEQEKQAEATAKLAAQDNKINEFLGSVGDKLVTEGVVTKVREISGDYGTSRLIEWLTTEGYTLKTFSTAQFVWGLNEGDAVTITGTVKKHETYSGFKSTVLTRCKAV